jgi:hypothetical protein
MTDETGKEGRPGIAGFLGMPKKVTALVDNESDRGAILILAAYLEEILGLIVNAMCLSDEEGARIQEHRGPAGGFDLKIQLCSALGWIHSSEAKGLQSVRKIRNNAAHFDNKRGFDVLFDSDQTIAHVENLAASQNLVLESRAPADVRHVFTGSVRLLACKLYVRVCEATRPAPPKSLKQKANEFREKHKDTEMGKALARIERDAKEGDPEALFELMKGLGEAIKGHLDETGVTDDRTTKP